MGGHLADKPTGPPAARYQTDEGAVFVLDRSTPRTLLKFENDPEIWVLDRANGPRGDVIYRNDLGEEMLRATRLGGVTVFTMRRPEGSPAAFDGATPAAAYRRGQPDTAGDRVLSGQRARQPLCQA